MRRIRIYKKTVVVLALTAASVVPGPARASQAPFELTFDKASPTANGVWDGTIGGDATGTVRTVLKGATQSGPILHVDFDWIISAGDKSFVADLDGILNLKTGAVVMNGKVTGGYLEGAQVHEEGQLVDPSTLRFQGTIQVAPSSAG